jgi:hypothetical protein
MDKGRLRFGLAFVGSYSHAEHSVEPEQYEPGIPDDEQAREHVLDVGLFEWDVDAQFGLHRRFAFELFFPVRMNLMRADFLDGDGASIPNYESIHHRDEVIGGIGDLAIGTRTGLVLPENVPRWNLDLLLGASLPTGGTEPDPFELGEMGEQHQHVFFGNGTVDPTAGLQSQLRFDKWSLVVWEQSRIPLYRNRHGFRGSRFVAGGIGAQSGFGLQKWSFLLQPEVFFATPAEWTNQPARNSGRLSLIATGGVFASPAIGWQLYLLAKVPYYTKAVGGQFRWPIVGILGARYTLETVNRREK